MKVKHAFSSLEAERMNKGRWNNNLVGMIIISIIGFSALPLVHGSHVLRGGGDASGGTIVDHTGKLGLRQNNIELDLLRGYEKGVEEKLVELFLLADTHTSNDNIKKRRLQNQADIGALGQQSSPVQSGARSDVVTLDNLRQTLLPVSGNVLFQRNSNQFRALTWLAENGPLATEPSGPSLESTYVMCLLWFATRGSSWVNPNIFMNSSRTVCDWHDTEDGAGVYCDSKRNHISKILLPNYNLTGSIPSELSYLSKLNSIDFENNHLKGNIPTEFGKFSNMYSFSVHHNGLSGELPSELGDIGSAFRGSPDIAVSFSIFLNNFVGSIPSEISNIPAKLIDLSENGFSGTIPILFGALTDVQVLDLGNTQLTGTIPPQLGNMKSLNILRLEKNNLTGTIPTELGKLSLLNILRLDSNKFTGTVPVELKNAEAMRLINIHRNQIFGDLNPLFCQSDAEGEFINNMTMALPDLTTLRADIECNDEVNGIARVTCECCCCHCIVDGDRLRETLYSISGETLYDVRSNQYKAAQWVLDNGPFGPFLEEAYIVTLLYYATGGAEWTNPYSFMNSSVSICSWNDGIEHGVFCDGAKTTILQINLKSNNLNGTIPSELSYFSTLEALHLEDNELFGSIPTEVGLFSNIYHFDVHDNLLTGTIPTEVGQMGNQLPDDLHLYFSTAVNKLGGTIPTEIGNMPARVVYLTENDLDGTLPTELARITSINQLDVGVTTVTGTIPTEFGYLTALQVLRLEENQLSGNIPSELGKLTNLKVLRFDYNNFEGQVPAEMANLKSLSTLNVHRNNITGDINPVFCQASSDGTYINNITMVYENLRIVKADTQCNAVNDVARVTCECCCCHCVVDENFLKNKLLPISGNALYDETTNQYKASDWVLSNGPFGPFLDEAYVVVLLYYETGGSEWTNPDIFMNTSISLCDWNDGDSTGIFCDASRTIITGINLRNYNLNGSIPSELSYFSSLETLHLEDNNLFGSIPSELGNFSNLYHFDIHNNELTGTIPTEIGSIGSRLPSDTLLYFSLAQNKLSGTIPAEIGNLPARTVELGENDLVGTLPVELSKLTNLGNLELGKTRLQSTIPTEFGDLSSLQYLRLEHNKLSGTVPSELGKLSLLKVVRLDKNNLEGEIPNELGNLRDLTTANFHDNYLTGNINPIFCEASPEGVFSDISTRFESLKIVRADTECSDDVANNEEVKCDCCCCYCFFDSNFVREAITPISGISLDDVSSDQYRAAQWVLDNGPFGDLLKEAYILSLLYFSTGGNGWVNPNIFMNPSLSICDWNDGVSAGAFCDPSKTSIVQINLGSYNLTGTLPSELGYLSSLEVLELELNNLVDSIPSEFGAFSNMHRFVVNDNALSNTIPTELGNIGNRLAVGANLYFSVASNRLRGTIPSELGNLRAGVVNLEENSLRGKIPVELSKLSDTFTLELGKNGLTGSIPSEFGDLTALQYLSLNLNGLSGPLPSELGKLSLLNVLKLEANSLAGPVPSEIGNLHNLTRITLHNNNITGDVNPIFCQSVPELGYINNFSMTFKNLSAVRVDSKCTSEVGIAVKVDCECCCCHCFINSDQLTDALLPISGYALYDNSSDQYKAADWVLNNGPFGPFLDEAYVVVLLYYAMGGSSWTNSDLFMNTSLSICSWNDGESTGIFCDASKTVISEIDLRNFNLSGTIPSELSYFSSLEKLHLEDNHLIGTIPSELGKFSNLYHFDLHNNELNGTVPTELGNIGRELPDGPLLYFSTSSNRLVGTIPTEIGNLRARTIDLSGNRMSGTIPDELRKLTDIDHFDLGNNRLEGRIPIEFGGLTALQVLRLENNLLSSMLPSELGNLSLLGVLRLDTNKFTGTVPTEITNLRNLTVINLHRNNISGDLNPLFCEADDDGTYLNNFNLVFKDLSAVRADSECTAEINGVAKVACECCCCHCYVTSELIENMLLPISGASVYDIRTNQYNAAEWLVENGPFGPFLDEAYVLVLLYFATAGSEWTNPNLFLNTSLSICDWNDGDETGVFCDDSKTLITEIKLHNMNLNGTLPSELSYFSSLEVLHLENNYLEGTIPSEFGSFSNMYHFDVHNNEVTGDLNSIFCERSSDGTYGTTSMTQFGNLVEVRADSDCGDEVAKVSCSCCCCPCMTGLDGQLVSLSIDDGSS